jgi:ABC-type nitrate/sulfonate/bicarbonate transport system permease component
MTTEAKDLPGTVVEAAPTVSLTRPRARWRLKPSTWRGALSILLAAALWEVIARVVVNNPLFFSPLSAVLSRGVALWASGELQKDVITSFQEFAVGFLIASALGIVMGMVMASSETVRDLVDPWVSMLYSTPTIALAPLLILWFGIGLVSHVAVVVLVVVFPVLINTYTGLANTEQNMIDVARSYGANRLQIFTKVRFPAALPFIIAGLRQGVARGLVGVVVAELFGARAGLGFLILVSAQTFDTAGLFAGVLILAGAGVLSVELVKMLERRMAPWRFQETSD